MGLYFLSLSGVRVPEWGYLFAMENKPRNKNIKQIHTNAAKEPW